MSKSKIKKQNEYKFYIYKLIDPRDNSVFYVGKGSGIRMYKHAKAAKRDKLDRVNPYVYWRIREIWAAGLDVIYEQIYFTNDEADAYKHEDKLVEQIGLDNLLNIVPGGRGTMS